MGNAALSPSRTTAKSHRGMSGLETGRSLHALQHSIYLHQKTSPQNIIRVLLTLAFCLNCATRSQSPKYVARCMPQCLSVVMTASVHHIKTLRLRDKPKGSRSTPPPEKRIRDNNCGRGKWECGNMRLSDPHVKTNCLVFLDAAVSPVWN